MEQMRALEQSQGDEGTRASKRRKIGSVNVEKLKYGDGTGEDSTFTEEQCSIWYQSERMKRMSALLRSLESMQQMLYSEIQDCHEENRELD